MRQSAQNDAPVLIIGGGIGGLAAALALRRVGIEAAVFERAPEVQEVGAGLSLWTNAMLALRALGVEQEVLACSAVIERSVVTTREGRRVSESDIGAASRAAGAPSVCVHRANLQRVLADALGRERIRLDSPCVALEAERGGVVAHFAGERSARGRLLIGADGIRSVVRAQLRGEVAPRYAGYLAWRGIAPMLVPECPPGMTLLVLGLGAQFGVFPCGVGQTYWFAVNNGPAGSLPDRAAWKQEVVRRFAGWPAPISALLAGTPDQAVLLNDVVDRPPTWPWGNGPVTLLGDAAHPTTPNLGQGACQALEDAVVLADLLRRRGLIPAALREYEQARRERTAFITRQSWMLGKVFQCGTPWLASFRNRLLGVPAFEGQGRALMDRLLRVTFPPL